MNENFYYGQRSAEEFESSTLTSGPWSPDFQHGGPPFGLAYRVAQDNAPGLIPTGGRFDILAPIKVGDLLVRAEVLHETRSTKQCSVSLTQGGRTVATATFWFVRPVPDALLPTPTMLPQDLISLDLREPAGHPIHLGFDSLGTPFSWLNHGSGFMSSCLWKFPEDIPFLREGAHVAACKMTTTLVRGSALSGFERIYTLADAVWSIGRGFSLEEMSAVNVDVTVHCVRPVESEWAYIRAATTHVAEGGLFASGEIFDQHGLCAKVHQVLVPAPPRLERVS
ncbi:thioesterase family protein [Nocardia sp. NPDC005978]|uniref:thioesterase family protein n=1 Tax=Nocardia sp. NPDC005978 TaxID=3156725 RepID=UPI0033B53CBF